jgi:hypothetical protein
MATARPFAYNTGSTINGTEQVGSLAVGTPTSGFSSTGLAWWNGADEDLGYVIATPVSGNTQPTPISGVTASVGFYRSTGLTDASFIELTNSVFNQTFTTANYSSYYLTTNGYWNSYPLGTGITYNFLTSSVSETNLSTYTFSDINVGGQGLIVITISGSYDGSAIATTLSSVTVGGQSATITQVKFGGSAAQQVISAIAYLNYTGTSTTTVVCNFSRTMDVCRIGSHMILNNTNNTPITSNNTTVSAGATSASVTLSSLGTTNKVVIAVSTNNSGRQNTWTNAIERYDATSGGVPSMGASAASTDPTTSSSSLTITDTFSSSISLVRGAALIAIAFE